MAEKRIRGARRHARDDSCKAVPRKVHPEYKTKYRVSNRAAYDGALAQRSDVTLRISTDAEST